MKSDYTFWSLDKKSEALEDLAATTDHEMSHTAVYV